MWIREGVSVRSCGKGDVKEGIPGSTLGFRFCGEVAGCVDILRECACLCVVVLYSVSSSRDFTTEESP